MPYGMVNTILLDLMRYYFSNLHLYDVTLTYRFFVHIFGMCNLLGLKQNFDMLEDDYNSWFLCLFCVYRYIFLLIYRRFYYSIHHRHTTV